MTSVTDSTIAALFYAQKPSFNFARLIADLDAALAGCPHEKRDLRWDHDDVAMLDIDGTRITLSWAEALTGPQHGLMTISVGPGPTLPDNDPLAPRREAICRMIAERIATRLPPVCMVWDVAKGVICADRLDDLSDMLALRACAEIAETLRAEDDDDVVPLHKPAAAESPATAEVNAPEMAEAAAETAYAHADAPVRPARPVSTRQGRATPPPHPIRDRIPADSDTISRLMARMDEELARGAAQPQVSDPCVIPTEVLTRQRAAQRVARARQRTAQRMTTQAPTARPAPAVANATPDLPRPKFAEANRLRAALYPEDDAPAAPQADATTMPARLAVGTLSATLLVTATPIGAALVVYNTFKGADMRMTARAVALTGAFVGLSQLSLVQSAFAAVI